MIGLELCKEAVEDAQYNARENGKWRSLVICIDSRCICSCVCLNAPYFVKRPHRS